MRRTLQILVFTALIIITLPMIKMHVFPHAIKKLRGAVVLAAKPNISFENWFNASYQDSIEHYFNDRIGFRPFFVRVRNQISYSLYDIANANGVVRGKEDYLYESGYINAYNGDDYLGSEIIEARADSIKQLQDTLENMGKLFLTCFAPGKATFYPQFFPDKYNRPKTDSTNYKRYLYYFKEKNINYIDFNQWFLDIKDTCNCMLYPKYGIHWSYYGMMLAADSLIKYVEAAMNIDMPDLKIKNIKKTRKISDGDYDIARGMNLLFQMPSDPMCYPEYEWVYRDDMIRPEMLMVADSYYWSMYSIGVGGQAFKFGGFWYYNKEAYPGNYANPWMVEQLDVDKVIKNTDIVILMSTEANLVKFNWGFTELFFSPGKYISKRLNEKQRKQEIIDKTIKYLRSQKNTMRNIKKKAEERQISVDSMLVLDAIWLMKHNKQNQ